MKSDDSGSKHPKNSTRQEREKYQEEKCEILKSVRRKMVELYALRVKSKEIALELGMDEAQVSKLKGGENLFGREKLLEISVQLNKFFQKHRVTLLSLLINEMQCAEKLTAIDFKCYPIPPNADVRNEISKSLVVYLVQVLLSEPGERGANVELPPGVLGVTYQIGHADHDVFIIVGDREHEEKHVATRVSLRKKHGTKSPTPDPHV